MSGLYVRLSVSFYSHRKTVRLLTRIGTDAYWLPPRIWSYAATHQPDGDFSDYSAEELAMLVGYEKDATSMLQALQEAKFFDGMKIHGWREHNAYHSVFSERARKAATVRWSRKRKDNERKGKEKEQASPSMLEASNQSPHVVPTAEDIYNAYPLKVGKPDALKSITRCFRQYGQSFLLERTLAFARARNGDKEFCPNPATWFNQERFNDDPETWLPKQSGQKKKPDKPWLKFPKPKPDFHDLYPT